MIPTIARRFTAQRNRQGLSLRAVSKIVGVSFASLARFERGDGTASEMLKHKVAKWLTTGEGSPKTPRHPTELSWVTRMERRVQMLEDRIAALEAST